MPGLNPTKIEWCDFTWNPIVGCSKGCSYCYARKMAARNLSKCAWCRAFIPHLHRERLDAPSKRKKPARIFVGSMGDMFDPQVKDVWIDRVLKGCNAAPQHQYVFLTQQEERLRFFKNIPSLAWCGATVVGNRYITQQSFPQFHVKAIKMYKPHPTIKSFVSFEPLLHPVNVDLTGLDWVIIGAQTNPTVLPDPKWTWAIIDQCRDLKIPVFLKNNLNFPIKVQQLPVRRR